MAPPASFLVRDLGRRPYAPVWQAMQRFTDQRAADAADEVWLVEHDPVFTQGQTGKAEHLLAPGDIPVVATDRGGQVTYHGPGQLVAYVLLDLKRLGIGVRELVLALENSIIAVLDGYGVKASGRRDAPGVYVDGAKIASLGLRVRRGCSFHGLAFNLDMDLAPFARINPCGYEGLAMTQLSALSGQPVEPERVARRLLDELGQRLGYTSWSFGPAQLPDSSSGPLSDDDEAS